MAASLWRCLRWLRFILPVATAVSRPLYKLRRAKAAGPPAGVPHDFYFMHVPKSGGLSFGDDALQVLEPYGYRMNSREGCYSWHKADPAIKGTLLMFRLPRKHVLSQYNFCLWEAVNRYREVVLEVQPQPRQMTSFDDWVRTWASLQASGWHGNFTPPAKLITTKQIEPYMRKMRRTRWQDPPFSPAHTPLSEKDWPTLDGGGTVWHHVNVPYACYVPWNLQSQRLTCNDEPMVYPQKIDAELAVRNMKESFFVGILEHYQTSICLLQAKVRTTLPGYCDCKDPAKWNTFSKFFEKDNENPSPKQKTVPEELNQAIDKLTDIDTQVYAEAWKRFVQEARQVEQTHGMRILCNETSPLLSSTVALYDFEEDSGEEE